MDTVLVTQYFDMLRDMGGKECKVIYVQDSSGPKITVQNNPGGPQGEGVRLPLGGKERDRSHPEVSEGMQKTAPSSPSLRKGGGGAETPLVRDNTAELKPKSPSSRGFGLFSKN
eukprot:GHVL01011755.1.p2 GENE.GHVL01011755.1~~GHVL01011755.1.p2  ORF type:complete len:114 (+),score=34.89 GHVL01011755.1:764-1105(+)